MERRTSVNPDRTFRAPLIVYNWSVDMALNYAFKVLEILLASPTINKIFVEDLEKINMETLLNRKMEKMNELDKSSENKQADSKAIVEYLEGVDKNILEKFVKGVSDPDLAIVIGGDGTTLWTNNLFGNGKKPPFLNFNLGTLGYMAIYSCDMIEEVMEELFNQHKKMTFEKRATLECLIYSIDYDKSLNKSCVEKENKASSECSDGNVYPLGTCCFHNESFKYPKAEKFFEGNALNDVVLEKTCGTNCIQLKIYLNDDPLTVVKCDGIILSTSTGSTAYNLSAGGSVIHYDVDSIILNAICPHSLSFRSIALPRDIKIKLVPCANSYNKVLVNIDGIDKHVLNENQFIEISLSDNYANFIVLEKFVMNRVKLWKQKIVDQLGWNNAFKNIN